MSSSTYGQSCWLGEMSELSSGRPGSGDGMLSSVSSADCSILTADLLCIAAAELSAGHAQKNWSKPKQVWHLGKGCNLWHGDTSLARHFYSRKADVVVLKLQ